MRAVTIVDGALEWAEHPDPVPGPGQLLVHVHAAGINNADLAQRAGFYPAPPGWPSDIPGMEFAGEVVGTGPGTTRFAVGQRVMALVGGGAQAELALCDEVHTMTVPDGIGWDEAGGFVEAFCTAHDALCAQCEMQLGDRVLVTGAAGGVGTAGVQLAAATGAQVTASVRRSELRDAVRALGAQHAIDPAQNPVRGPFDVVLELIGGESFAASMQALAVGGRVAVIGVGGGGRAELDLFGLMGKRARVHGSTLRARSHAEKELVVRATEAKVVPLLAAGRVRVPVSSTFRLDEAQEAYERFREGGKLGKLVLVRG